MAALRKAVLAVLMTVIGLTPLFVQVGYARMASVEKVSITLPQGAELSNKEKYMVSLFHVEMTGDTGCSVPLLGSQWAGFPL